MMNKRHKLQSLSQCILFAIKQEVKKEHSLNAKLADSMGFEHILVGGGGSNLCTNLLNLDLTIQGLPVDRQTETPLGTPLAVINMFVC